MRIIKHVAMTYRLLRTHHGIFDYHQEDLLHTGTEYGKTFVGNAWSAANQGSLDGVHSLPFNHH